MLAAISLISHDNMPRVELNGMFEDGRICKTLDLDISYIIPQRE